MSTFWSQAIFFGLLAVAVIAAVVFVGLDDE